MNQYSKNYTVKDIANKIEIPEKDILNVYMIGSRVYGTFNPGSDYDFIVVTDTELNNREFRRGNLNIHVYTREHFKNKLNEQKAQFIEAFFSPIVLKEEVRFHWVLDKRKMLKEFIMNSDETFNGYLKNKDDVYLATKKLFHSIRVLAFAGQLIQDQQIDDWEAANVVFQEIQEALKFNESVEKYYTMRIDIKEMLVIDIERYL